MAKQRILQPKQGRYENRKLYKSVDTNQATGRVVARLGWDFYKEDISFFLLIAEGSEGSERYSPRWLIQPLAIQEKVEIVAYTGAESALHPSFQLDAPAAQMLMDDLWQAGIRPSQGVPSEGQKEALQEHIDTLRKLLFGGLDFIGRDKEPDIKPQQVVGGYIDPAAQKALSPSVFRGVSSLPGEDDSLKDR
jgi:hypothetical protein